MKEELIILWREYIVALLIHQESNSLHMSGWIQHHPGMSGFIDWLDYGRIRCGEA